MIGMTEARKLLRGRKGDVSLPALRRWASPHRGRTVNGTRVVLRSVKVGGRLMTTAEWVEDFARDCERAGERQGAEGYRPPRGRAAALRAAQEFLDSRGVK